MATTTTTPQPLDSEKALSALVGLLAAEREDRLEPNGNGARSTEFVLWNAGLSNSEIATLLAKKRDTVEKAVKRARNASGASTKTGKR